MNSSQSIVRTTDGTQWMHRMLIGVVRLLGVRPLYVVMGVFVVPFYILLRRRAFLSVWHYMRRRQGFGWWRSLRLSFLNHYRFG